MWMLHYASFRLHNPSSPPTTFGARAFGRALDLGRCKLLRFKSFLLSRQALAVSRPRTIGHRHQPQEKQLISVATNNSLDVFFSIWAYDTGAAADPWRIFGEIFPDWAQIRWTSCHLCILKEILPLSGHGKPQSPTWGHQAGCKSTLSIGDAWANVQRFNAKGFFLKQESPTLHLYSQNSKYEIMISHKRSLIVCRGHVKHHSFRSCFLCQLVPASCLTLAPKRDLLHKLTCCTVDIEAIFHSFQNAGTLVRSCWMPIAIHRDLVKRSLSFWTACQCVYRFCWTQLVRLVVLHLWRGGFLIPEIPPRTSRKLIQRQQTRTPGYNRKVSTASCALGNLRRLDTMKDEPELQDVAWGWMFDAYWCYILE